MSAGAAPGGEVERPTPHHARDRQQFGQRIFARIADQLVAMVAGIMVARPVGLFAARQGQRRALRPGGRHELLGAEAVFRSADDALQIHGGNGDGEEYPSIRVFCDARSLDIFEGAAEIQANVIARRILGL